MERPPEPSSIDELVEQLQAKVQERERQGQYPADLVHDLQAHFRRISSQRALPDLEDVHARLAALDALSTFDTERIPLGSGVPGGAKLHALVARLVARQTEGILEQMRDFATGVRAVLDSLAVALEQPHAHVHTDLVGQVDALFEQVAAFERGPTDSSAAVADLHRRVEALEGAERSRTFRPFFSRARIEEALRGSRDEVLARNRSLLPCFDGCAPVLDVGCGRGELLELLRDEGIEARGVEVDERLVEECRRHGLQVEHGDALDRLRRSDDGSLGAIALVRVAEYLAPQQLVELVLLAHGKLRPTGRLVVETADPRSPRAQAHRLHVDPTIAQPVHPAFLSLVAREAGFEDVHVEPRSTPAGEDPVDYVFVATR
jgi:SAM-dependent methyltransferase